jgi:ferredoxin
VPARIGQTLLEAALMHNVEILGPCEGGGGPSQVLRSNEWTEDTFGDGPNCYFCHVKIPSTYQHLLPHVFDSEKKAFHRVWGDEMSKTSRLACQITLGKEHDGLVVLVPNPPITDACI